MFTVARNLSVLIQTIYQSNDVINRINLECSRRGLPPAFGPGIGGVIRGNKDFRFEGFGIVFDSIIPPKISLTFWVHYRVDSDDHVELGRFSCPIRILETSSINMLTNLGSVSLDEIVFDQKDLNELLEGFSQDEVNILLPESKPDYYHEIEASEEVISDPDPENYFLQATQNTVLKASPIPSQDLPESEKVQLTVPDRLSLTSFQEEGNHVKVTLANTTLGDRQTWFAYKGHVRITCPNDTEVVWEKATPINVSESDLAKKTALAIISVFETGQAKGDYGTIVCHPRDPGGLTFGKHQTTIHTGNLYFLIKEYCDTDGAKYVNELRPYLVELEKKLASRKLACSSGSQELKDIMRILRDSGSDPVMQAVQDEFFERAYWIPAMKTATDLGINTPLGQAVVYDSFIHGSWNRMRDRTNQNSGLISRIGEQAWIKAYIDTRRHWLANHSNYLLRNTVYRMDAFKQLIRDNNWNLTLPLTIRGQRIDQDLLASNVSDQSQSGDFRLLKLTSPRMSGKDVKQVQQALKDKAYFPPEEVICGTFGPNTESKVKAFQQDNPPLKVDGIVGLQTLRALGLSESGPSSLSYSVFVADPNPPLKVRSGAGTSYEVVGTLNNNTALTVVDTAADSQGRKWLNISSPRSGWVFAEFTSTSGVRALTSPPNLRLSISDQYDYCHEIIIRNGGRLHKRNIISFRKETNTKANSGRGVYDDKTFVIWKDSSGRKFVKNYISNTEPSYQYIGRFGDDTTGDGRKELGRVPVGYYEYKATSSHPMYGKVLIPTRPIIAERDSDHNGTFEENEGRSCSRTSMLFHAGGQSNTGSAGCQTMPPNEYNRFWRDLNSSGDPGTIGYTLVRWC